MTERVVVEGADLGATLAQAALELGAKSAEELGWELDREHFRQGAYTVKLAAWLRTPEERARKQAGSKLAEEARTWTQEMLRRFGTEATVTARQSGVHVHVQVLAESDASLLIGREGKNIRAFQLLLEEVLRKIDPSATLKLDVESADRDRGDGRRGRDDDRRGREDRPRGRDERPRDRDARPRDRDDRPRDRDDRHRDSAASGPDASPEDERRRDEDIQAEARQAAERVLAGEEVVRLGRMNSYERHLAHTTIKEIAGVGSRSVGQGSRKKIEVFRAAPGDAP